MQFTDPLPGNVRRPRNQHQKQCDGRNKYRVPEFDSRIHVGITVFLELIIPLLGEMSHTPATNQMSGRRIRGKLDADFDRTPCGQ